MTSPALKAHFVEIPHSHLTPTPLTALLPSSSSWLQQRLLGSDWLEADVVVSPSATSPHTPHYTRACYYGERKSWSTELLIGVCLNTPGSSPMESWWYSAVLCLVPHVVHLGTDVRRAVPVVPHAARHLLTEDPREKSRVELDIWTTQPSFPTVIILDTSTQT